MADNLTTTTTVSTVPNATVIATDDAGSAHYQKVKLVDGTADSTTAIPGTSNGLQVVTAATVIDLTLSLDTGGPYSDGDVLAAAQELANAVRAATTTGVIQSIHIVDKDDQAQALDIVISDATITLGTENSAVSISDADAAKILGIVEIATGDYVNLVNSQAVTKTGMGIVIKPASGTSVYISAVSRGTGTYTASGIVLRIGIIQD